MMPGKNTKKELSVAEIRKKLSGNITVVKDMRDYSKDPTVLKRAKEAKAFLKKHGLPESFKKKRK